MAFGRRGLASRIIFITESFYREPKSMPGPVNCDARIASVLRETCRLPDWRHVVITSDILFTQIPVVIKICTWFLLAATHFTFIVFLA